MTRFYFDLYNDDIVIDEEGIECVDATSAYERAIFECRNLACELIRTQGRLNLNHHIVVRNAEKKELAIVRFGDAIAVTELTDAPTNIEHLFRFYSILC